MVGLSGRFASDVGGDLGRVRRHRSFRFGAVRFFRAGFHRPLRDQLV